MITSFTPPAPSFLLVSEILFILEPNEATRPLARIRKGQFKLGKLRTNGKTAPESGAQFSLHEPMHALDVSSR